MIALFVFAVLALILALGVAVGRWLRSNERRRTQAEIERSQALDWTGLDAEKWR